MFLDDANFESHILDVETVRPPQRNAVGSWPLSTFLLAYVLHPSSGRDTVIQANASGHTQVIFSELVRSWTYFA